MSAKELVIDLPAGRYVVAVSGGVDSVVLLDLMSKKADLQVIVAHYHHGIRGADADGDEKFVAELAKKYSYTFDSDRGNLGAGASEATARVARYAFLVRLQREYVAKAIVLAHHQDDVVETIIINLLRGTSWRGISSLRSHKLLRRPLLAYQKADLVAYATSHNLTWREDATNLDQSYLRNYIRQTMVPRLEAKDPGIKQKYRALYEVQCELLSTIERETDRIIKQSVVFYADNSAKFQRYQLIMWSDQVGREVLQAVCSRLTGQRLLSHQIDGALIFARSARIGAELSAGSGFRLIVTRSNLIVSAIKK